MDLVGSPRAGANELVPVADQELQIHEQDLPVSRRKPLLTGDDPGDGDRIDRVGLALRATMASLPVREGSWNLTDVLPRLKQTRRCPRTITERALDADDPVDGLLLDPPDQRSVPLRIVGELELRDHPSETIDRRRGERSLVRIDPDRHLHAGLLPFLDYDGDQRSDKQALGQIQPSMRSLPPVRFRPEGRSPQRSTAKAATCCLRVTSGRFRTLSPIG
jgi:hypothetical protein